MISGLSVSNSDSIIAVEHSEIMNVLVIERFTKFLDVSSITLRAYRSGIKQFIEYLNSQNVRVPNRESVVMFKKTLIAEGANLQQLRCIFLRYVDFLRGVRRKDFARI